MSEHWDAYNKALPRLHPSEIKRIADAQFGPENARILAAVAIPESYGGKPGAIGDSGGSVGLWQINRIHFRDLIDYGIITVPSEVRASLDGASEEDSKALWAKYAHPQLADPVVNAKAAWMVGWGQEPSRGADRNKSNLEGSFNFEPWTMYRNGEWETGTGYLDDPEFAEMTPIEVIDSLLAGDGIGALPVDDGLGEGSRLNPRDSTTWGWDADFGERMQWAADQGDIDFQAVAGRMAPGEIAALRQRLGPDDPRIASVLSQAQFPEGRAAIVGYRTAEDARRAPVILRKFGLTAHPEFPFLISPIGAELFDAGKDVLSQLGDWEIGSLFNRRGSSLSDEQRLQYERSLDGRTSYE